MMSSLPRLRLPLAVAWLVAIPLITGASSQGRADDRPASTAPITAQPARPDAKGAADKLVALNKEGTVLLDASGKRLLLKTTVVFREGLLEMLCCLKQTKEHESIVSVDAKAYVVHTGLLALGAEPGKPVQFVPKFSPPSGQRIDIFVQWKDERGRLQRVPAQQWIRHITRRYYGEPLAQLPDGVRIPEDSELRYDRKNRELSWYGPMSAEERNALLNLSNDPAFQAAIKSFFKRSQPRQMQSPWVFVGSSFVEDEETGKKYYQAEGGDLICVANFPSATIDVGVESSATGEESLLYEAYTERIPPLGTEVTIELIPVFKKPGEDVGPE